MKKIGFLFVGIILAIAISLQNMQGASAAFKRSFQEVARDIEGGLIGAYQVIRSFVTGLEGI
jgi:hypothetical protein